jgi:hypothetical protein
MQPNGITLEPRAALLGTDNWSDRQRQASRSEVGSSVCCRPISAASRCQPVRSGPGRGRRLHSRLEAEGTIQCPAHNLCYS